MTFIAVLVALALQATTPAPPATRGQEKEVYTLYSLMITSRMTQRVDADEIYLIGTNTVVDSGGPGCVRVPPEDASALAEIVADYNSRVGVSVTLTKQFDLPKPYELLERDKVSGFLQDALDATPQILPRGGARPVNRNPLYPKAKNVIRLSDVYFDTSRTSALAWVAIYETSVDFRGAWRPYRKSANGVWEENRSWSACGRGAVR